jgi:hypothetical protein
MTAPEHQDLPRGYEPRRAAEAHAVVPDARFNGVANGRKCTFDRGRFGLLEHALGAVGVGEERVASSSIAPNVSGSFTASICTSTKRASPRARTPSFAR